MKHLPDQTVRAAGGDASGRAMARPRSGQIGQHTSHPTTAVRAACHLERLKSNHTVRKHPTASATMTGSKSGANETTDPCREIQNLRKNMEVQEATPELVRLAREDDVRGHDPGRRLRHGNLNHRDDHHGGDVWHEQQLERQLDRDPTAGGARSSGFFDSLGAVRTLTTPRRRASHSHETAALFGHPLVRACGSSATDREELR